MRPRTVSLLVVSAVLTSCALPAVTTVFAADPPRAARVSVTDVYHGIEVIEDYRWLEDGDDPKVKEWTQAENAYARSVLDSLPDLETIREQITKLRKLKIAEHYWMQCEGGTVFCLRQEPPKQQPFLVAMVSEEDPDSARIVVDPNAIDPSGGTSIDWFVPSPDGRLVAVSLSKGGTEEGTLHIVETATGRDRDEPIARVSGGTAGGSVAWDQAGNGFYYTRYPREGERPEADLDFFVQVYHHRIGEPEDRDRYEVGYEFPRIAEVFLRRSLDGRWCLANVANGDGGEYEQLLRTAGGRWVQLTRFEDMIVDAVFGPEDALFLLSRKDAPRGRILRLRLDRAGLKTPDTAHAEILIDEGEGPIKSEVWNGVSGMIPCESSLLVIQNAGGPEEIRAYDYSGEDQGRLPIAPLSAVREVVALRGRGQDAVLYRTRSFLEPDSWYRWTNAPDAGERIVKTALSKPWPVDFGDAEVVREWAVSKDGTRVPMSIVRRKGTKLDGNNPTLLTGYGGYGIPQTPYFDAVRRLWLDRGGVFALANLRGGGEFGEEWHRAGNLAKKQNVFDDFIACAERLIQSGYTSKNRLAIEGGSNGGLLMGAVLTQRPDLFRAVVSHAGVYDMLRVELTPNGVFNVPEYGSVKDLEQFRALLAYSPYHNVVDGRAYPDVLLLADANDPRVEAWHSRKFAARLQAAGARNVLLRSSASMGHGLATALDEQIEIDTDVYGFLFDRLNMRINRATGAGAGRN